MNPNDCAYPSTSGEVDGLTKREHMAVLVLNGLLSNPDQMDAIAAAAMRQGSSIGVIQSVCQIAVTYTDALIKEL